MAYQDITKYSSKNYTPASQVAAVFGQPRNIKSITIHWWGNYGQKFDNVVHFLCTNNSPTSAHYVIEDGRSACIVSPNDAAWHSGNSTGNATSIGLELRPEATDGDYATAAEVIRELRAVYGNLPLVPHKHWHNTACPGKWDLNRLDKLARGKATITAAASKPVTATKPAKKDIMATLDKEDYERIAKAVWGYKNPDPKISGNRDAYSHLRVASNGVGQVLSHLGGLLKKLPGAVWGYKNLSLTNDDAYQQLADIQEAVAPAPAAPEPETEEAK